MSGNPLAPGVEWLVEQYVPFTREPPPRWSGPPSGQAAVYPVVRTVQTNGICTEVVAPCPGLSDEHALAAQQVALRIAEALDVVGMLAVGGAVRHPRGRAGQRGPGDASAQQRPLVHRGRGHQPVRERPARLVLDLPLGYRRPERRTR